MYQTCLFGLRAILDGEMAAAGKSTVSISAGDVMASRWLLEEAIEGDLAGLGGMSFSFLSL